MPVPEIRPHHFGVSVPSLAEAIEWYGAMLGFEVEMQAYIAIIPAQVAFLRRDAFRIELFEVAGAAALPPARREPNQDVRTHGNKHMCFAVDDLAAMLAHLRGRGADIVFSKVVQDTPMAFLRDNAGNLIELIELIELREGPT